MRAVSETFTQRRQTFRPTQRPHTRRIRTAIRSLQAFREHGRAASSHLDSFAAAAPCCTALCLSSRIITWSVSRTIDQKKNTTRFCVIDSQSSTGCFWHGVNEDILLFPARSGLRVLTVHNLPVCNHNATTNNIIPRHPAILIRPCRNPSLTEISAGRDIYSG
jgi:hypothetical protein